MSTLGPRRTISAPLPLEIVMLRSVISIFAPDAISSLIPPSGPGRSVITSALPRPVCSTMLGLTGFPFCAAPGTSDAVPQKQPLQIGNSGSPCSNSIHTAAPTCGTNHVPDFLPVTGTHGNAHDVGTAAPTSGTEA